MIVVDYRDGDVVHERGRGGQVRGAPEGRVRGGQHVDGWRWGRVRTGHSRDYSVAMALVLAQHCLSL